MSYLPSLTALRCLDTSVRLGSFTRAAREMHLTQSAVSHQILELERQLEVKLFARERNQLVLTSAGRMYWDDTRPVLEKLQHAAERVAASKRVRNSLTISVPPSLANAWLMPRVSTFVSNNPDITLNLVNRQDGTNWESRTEDATIELSEGSATGSEFVRLLSLVYKPYVSRSLVQQSGLADRLSDAAVLDIGALPELLQSIRLIRTSMTDAWEGWLKLSGLDARVSPEQLASGPVYAQASLALMAVLAGTGAAMLPRYVSEPHLRSTAIVCLGETGWPATKAYYLRWPANSQVGEPLRRFADWTAMIAESEAA